MFWNIALVVGFLAACCGSTHGGLVLFAPEEVNLDRRATVPGAMEVAVAVIKDSGLPMAESADILFGSDDISLTGFHCGLGLPGPPGGCLISHGPFGVYPFELHVQVSRDLPPLPPLLTGTLMFDLTGLPNGEYGIEVNSDRDGGLSTKHDGGIVDPLAGSLAIHIVPEPSTVSLLVFGASGAMPFALRRHCGA